MNTHRTIRYRLHPNTQVKARRLHELAGTCRFVCNHFVGVLRDEYEVYGRCDPRWYDLGPRFTRLRTQMPWLQHYSANIVKLSLKPIEVTYKQFWKGEGGLPKFHGRHTDKKNRKTRAYHECVACGNRDHADVNAALNILAFGNGASGRGGGGVARPEKRQTGTEVRH